MVPDPFDVRPDELTGAEAKRLEDALISAFPERPLLERMLDLELDIKLNHLVGEQLGMRLVAYEVIKVARNDGWVGRLVSGARQANPDNPELAAFAVRFEAGLSPLPTQQVADTSLFDLNDLDAAYWDCVAARSGRSDGGALLGFGVTLGDDLFLVKLRERLRHHLGPQTEDRSIRSLDPRTTSVQKVVADLTRLRTVLRSAKNVIAVVRAETADDADVEALWRDTCVAYPDALEATLVVLIVRPAAAAFPERVVPLPSPAFRLPHLLEWTNRVVRDLRQRDPAWDPPALWARRWSLRVSQCCGAGQVDVLDTHDVYVQLDEDVRQLGTDAPAFRKALGKE
jgi:hypothetical protein